MRIEKEKNSEYLTFLNDRLYGGIRATEDDLRLFQTPELRRLREVSLSTTPPWLLPAGKCASRFEHSIGVAHLAKIIGKKEEFKEIAKDLYFASLAHDLGTPPFSHLSEHFQITILGKNHEEFLEEMIYHSKFAKEVKKQGGSIERIINFVAGKEKPFSDLINGSMDIDNLDNSLRYGLSLELFQEKFYLPENLASAYTLKDNHLAILPGYSQDLSGWRKTRTLVYKFVYSSVNLSPSTMIYRALDLAAREGELTKDHFFMTDPEAFQYLEEKCNKRTQNLIESAKKGEFYPRIFNFSTNFPSETIRKVFSDRDNRQILADEISQFLHVPLEYICIYLGKSREYKELHLPTINEKKFKEPSSNKLVWMAQVYVHPNLVEKTNEISEFMREKLKI